MDLTEVRCIVYSPCAKLTSASQNDKSIGGVVELSPKRTAGLVHSSAEQRHGTAVAPQCRAGAPLMLEDALSQHAVHHLSTAFML